MRPFTVGVIAGCLFMSGWNLIWKELWLIGVIFVLAGFFVTVWQGRRDLNRERTES